MSNNGRGNRKEQFKRRRRNNKDVPLRDEHYEMIDGNMTRRPVGYCSRYRGYLTQNMQLRHNCLCRNCPRFKEIEEMA